MLKEWLSTNKIKVIGGVFLVLALSLIAFVAVKSCATSRVNNNHARYGVVKVSIDAALREPTDTWSEDNLATVRRALTEANRLGPTFQLVQNGSEADVVIYKASLNCRQGEGAGRFTLGTTYVEVDPRCTTSTLELQTVVLHELGHRLGMSHVCRNNESNDCSSVGRGDAVMNPNVLYETNEDRQGPGFTAPYTGAISTFNFTALDVQEFQRVWNNRTTY